MASIDFIVKRIEGKRNEIDKLQKKLQRIRKVESQNWNDPNPYMYTEDDLKYCLADLDTAQSSLEKYRQELRTLHEKASSRNVKPILDFLDDWKLRVRNYYMSALNEYFIAQGALRELRKEAASFVWGTAEWQHAQAAVEEALKEFNENIQGIYEEREVTEYHYSYTEHRNILCTVKKEVKVQDGKWEYARPYFCTTLAGAEERLNRDLNAEAEAKYDDIVNRTTSIVGEIVDASLLRCNEKGNLDGVIVGTRGNARVETIGAGGYNIQCYHFRTLIHKVG